MGASTNCICPRTKARKFVLLDFSLGQLAQGVEFADGVVDVGKKAAVLEVLS